MANWDTSGDGKIDTVELLGNFDSDGDGNLDASELQNLAEQLSGQLEYNNSLLQQIQDLEQKQLTGQREISSAQEQAKKAAASLQESKAEAGEAKRKLKITQEIADTVSKQLKDVTNESNHFKSVAEHAMKGNKDSSGQVAALAEDKKRLQSQLHIAQSGLTQARADSEFIVKQLKEQNDVLKHNHELMLADLNAVRSQVAPLENERDAQKERAAELAQTLADATRRQEAEAQARTAAERQVREMSGTIDALCGRQNEAQGKFVDMREDNDRLRVRAEQLEEQNAELEAQMFQLQETDAQQHAELLRKDEAISALHHDVEQLKIELAAVSRAKQVDQQKWVEKFAAIQRESQSAIGQTKAHAEEFAMDAQKHAADATAARKQAEEKCSAAQDECAELHKLIEDLQAQHRADQQGWEQQRDNLQANCVNYQRQCYSAADMLKKATEAHDSECESLQSALKAGKDEQVLRGDQFVQAMSVVQLAVRRYRDESLVAREKARENANLVAQLQKVVCVLKDRFNGSWGMYQPEVEGAMKTLFNKTTDARKQLDEARDTSRKLQVAVEDEKANAIALEDMLNKSEYDRSAMGSRNADAARMAEERLAQSRARIDALGLEKEEVEVRLKRQQASLESVMAQSRAIQVANQNMQSALNASSTKFAAMKQDCDSRITQLTAEGRALQQARDSQAVQAEQAKLQVKRLTDELVREKAQLELAQTDVARVEKANEASQLKRSNAAEATTQQLGQYQKQLKQTQEILKVCAVVFLHAVINSSSSLLVRF